MFFSGYSVPSPDVWKDAENSPFLSAIESKKHQGASGPDPHLTNAT